MRRRTVLAAALVAALGLLPGCSRGHLDFGLVPHLVAEATDSIAVAIVEPKAIRPTEGRDGYRSYEVDLSTTSLIPVTEQAAGLQDRIHFERPTEYWRPIEDLVSEFDRVVLLVKDVGGTVFGLDGSSLVIVDWSFSNWQGQPPQEEASIFNEARGSTPVDVALAELAKARLAELQFGPGLPPDQSGVGFGILDAMWPDRHE